MATPPGARSSAEFSAVINNARVAPNPNPRTMTTAVSTHAIGTGAAAKPVLGLAWVMTAMSWETGSRATSLL